MDPGLPVWCCRTCDRMLNAALDVEPRCEKCDRAMVAAFAGASPGNRGPSLQRFVEEKLATPTGLTLMWIGMLLPIATLALHPVYRWFALGFVPVMVMPVILGGAFVANLVSGLPELRAIARDRRLRVVHGFEHATAHVLEADRVRVRWGSTSPDGSFELAVEHGEKKLAAPAFRAALESAVARIKAGETALAYHPRCGSTWIALLLVGALASILIALAGLFAQMPPLSLGALIGCLVIAMLFGSRPLGWLIQRHVSVDTRFHRARVLRVTLNGSSDHEVVYKAELAVDLEAGHDTSPKPVAKPREPELPKLPPPPPRVRVPMDGIACPSCKWAPEGHDLWKCECGWKWNPFTTDGECLACGHRFPETKCLSCKAVSPHDAWKAKVTSAA